MSDLFQGQTMTYAAHCISAGAAHTFTFPFQPDAVQLRNLTDWASTAGGLPDQWWFRDLTTEAHAYQNQVIDSAAAQSFNYIDLATNGFTSANTAGGVGTRHATITGVTAADPCVVTHSAYTFQDNQIVILTDLGSEMPTERGMSQINNKRYRITVLTDTTFSLQDVITGEDIDSSAYTAYVEGGRITLETNVLTLNNPTDGTYTPNSFIYDEIEYKLTCGTSVIGSDGEILLIVAYKFGTWENLGDIA